jgi:hypothetical protein
MTLMGMRGAMSVSGFGRFPHSSGPPAGSFGLFASAQTTPTARQTSAYKFSTDTASAGTQLATQVAVSGAGAGNVTQGVICIGNTLKTTNVYTYASNAVVAGGALASALNTGAGAGNDTTALFVSGKNNGSSASNLTNIFDYASSTSGAGTNLVNSTQVPAACGILAYVIIATAAVNGSASKTTNKYTYSSGATAAATALANNYASGNAVSNANVGVFFGQATVSSRYVWSGETSVAGATIPISISFGASVGNDTTGVVTTGSNVQAYKYNYAADSFSAGGVLPQTVGAGAGASQGVTGVSM